MTETIAIAYDGSEAAREALGRAAPLLRGNAAAVICAWAPEAELGPPADSNGVPYSYGERLALASDLLGPELERAARETAERAANQLRDIADDVQVLTPAAHGDVADVLLQEAQRVGAAAIVVGSCRRSRLAQLLRGGVTARLLEESPIPVIVVRQGAA